jgi:hypothetical protein
MLVNDRVENRDVVDLTVRIGHNIVDGSPSARFGAEIRRQNETAAAIH